MDELVDSDVARLLERTSDAAIIVDGERRYRYVNPVARRLLRDAGEIRLGSVSPFGTDRSPSQDADPQRTRIGSTDIEYSVLALSTPLEGLDLVCFAAVHGRSRRDRQLDAFLAIASTMAEIEPLERILDHLAAEVKHAADLEVCTVALIGSDSQIRTAGVAGLPPGYASLLEQCRLNGAPLATVRAQNSGEVVIDTEWRSTVLFDRRWAPLHDTVRGFRLGTLIAAPLRVEARVDGGQLAGALTGFVRAGREPDEEDILFLRAMADHAALAISHTRMFRRLRSEVARNERRRLSRELHDSVTQELFSLALRTKGLERTTADRDTAHELADMHEQITSALSQMRSLVLQGRAVDVGEEGLVTALRSRCAAMSRAGGPTIAVVADDTTYDLDDEAEEDIFMLAVEAVRNALKHANASTITVTIARAIDDARTLVVRIIDDGRGISPGPRSAAAVGMDAMTERARAHGGELSVHSGECGGTAVTARYDGLLAAPLVTLHEWNSEVAV